MRDKHSNYTVMTKISNFQQILNTFSNLGDLGSELCRKMGEFEVPGMCEIQTSPPHSLVPVSCSKTVCSRVGLQRQHKDNYQGF